MTNLDELKKLQELRASGAITEEEFSQMKQSIISGKKTKISTNKDSKLPEILLIPILTIIGLVVWITIWQSLTDTSTVWDEWADNIDMNVEKVRKAQEELEKYEKENMSPNTQPVK